MLDDRPNINSLAQKYYTHPLVHQFILQIRKDVRTESKVNHNNSRY